MSNPAKKLHDQFEAWQEGSSTPQTDRQMADLPAATAAHRVAMRHLLDVERRIDLLADDDIDVSDYKAHLVVWTEAIIVHPNGWVGSSYSNNYPPHASMQTLRALSQLLDSHFKQVRTDDPRFADLLAEIDRALEEDDSLDDAMRGYIEGLLDEIRRTLDANETVDSFDLNETLDRLWVTLRAAAHESKNPGVWERASGVVRDLMIGAIVNLPAWAIAAHQAQQALPGH